MNSLFTKMAPQESKTHRQNLRLTLFIAVLLSSSSSFANRPAMEERAAASQDSSDGTVQSMPVAQPEAMTEQPATSPSAVEIMMQQQNQQTYQTGDVLQLPAKEIQPGETLKIQLLEFPRRGMSMNKVQLTYGEPIAISDSVGKPPITRWTYNDRVVYFEYSTVLHVVARHESR